MKLDITLDELKDLIVFKDTRLRNCENCEHAAWDFQDETYMCNNWASKYGIHFEIYETHICSFYQREE